MKKIIGTEHILNKITEVIGEDTEKLNNVYLRLKNCKTGEGGRIYLCSS